MREIQARFFSKIGGLIGGGVPWIDAFAVGARSVRDEPALHAALERVVDRMRLGDAPSDALAEEALFSDEVIRTVRAGEEMGDLESKSIHIADQLLSGTFEAGRRVVVTTEAAAELEALVDDARASGGTHVHLEPTEVGGRVRVRRAGRLDDGSIITGKKYAALLAAIETASPVPASMADFCEGPGAVLRLEPELTVDSIEIPPGDADRIRAWADRGGGLVLLAGRPAVARVALLRTLLGALPPGARACAVIEDDPLPLPDLLHVTADEDEGTVAALAEALGQDPDAVVLPEITDARTARRVVRAARGDRLLAVGAPVDGAAAALASLAARGVEPEVLADAFAGAAAIRLVHGLCPECREPAGPDRETAARLDLPADGAWSISTGCDACGRTGHRGRIALVEILEATEEIRRALRRGATVEALRESSGEPSLRDVALARSAAGEVSLSEALAETPF